MCLLTLSTLMYALCNRKSLSNQFVGSSLFLHFSLIAANELLLFIISAGGLQNEREMKKKLLDAGE